MKARHVLRKLEAGKYEASILGGHKWCPFCTRSIRTNFNNVLMHTETLGSSHANVGQTVNVHAFQAKHKALGIHLHRLHNLAIEKGEILAPKPKPPKIQGLGSRKYQKRQREEAEAARRETARRVA
jgi:hypothetical protein